MSEFIADGVIAERQRRARVGADLCRSAIAGVLARTAVELPASASRSERILALAQQRAAEERRASRSRSAE